MITWAIIGDRQLAILLMEIQNLRGGNFSGKEIMSSILNIL